MTTVGHSDNTGNKFQQKVGLPPGDLQNRETKLQQKINAFKKINRLS
ncbi:hypothetical protein [Bacillus mobilis]